MTGFQQYFKRFLRVFESRFSNFAFVREGNTDYDIQVISLSSITTRQCEVTLQQGNITLKHYSTVCIIALSKRNISIDTVKHCSALMSVVSIEDIHLSAKKATNGTDSQYNTDNIWPLWVYDIFMVKTRMKNICIKYMIARLFSTFVLNCDVKYVYHSWFKMKNNIYFNLIYKNTKYAVYYANISFSMKHGA